MDETKFWAGKKVLITGVNGFIGGNLARYMVDRKADVFGLVRNVHENSYLYFEGIVKRTNIIRGDLCDRAVLQRIIAEERIQVVFHLAAQVEVGVARAYPFLTWETNIRGTYCLLEAVRENREHIEAVIIASSDKAYGEYGRKQMPYREDYPLIPVFPYDVSKACADMIARSYASDVYKFPVIVTRFCNIYGPGQLNFSALIPDSTRCALGYGEFIPRSNGKQIRDYIYVDDAIQLYALLAENMAHTPKLAGEVFNAGTNEPKSVREIVEKVFLISNRPDKYAEIESQWMGKETIGEIDCQFMTFDKVNRYFGWKPETDLDTGIHQTIDWFREYLANKYY